MRNDKLAVIGLGYVGLPLAVAFSKYHYVVGYDTNEEKLQMYQNGYDLTGEIGNQKLRESGIEFTYDKSKLQDVDIYIISVPTPICGDKTPDMDPIIFATKTVEEYLENGNIVIYESTVYPGLTERVCIPILEKNKKLKAGQDFFVGYSPERINPGDKLHNLSNIKKIVSGINEKSCDIVENLYGEIIEVGTHRVSSIKVAEAVKVVENSQRDINIAFMNEIAMVFDKMNINSSEVIEAMNTKWNALKFNPGLVGGHCISVDPYYFIYESEHLGNYLQLMSSARRINDGMGEYIGNQIVRQLILSGKKVAKAKITILGFTFKENCSDIRNTRVIEIYETLKEMCVDVQICDDFADKKEVKNYYGIDLVSRDDVKNQDGLVFAVAHEEYRQYDTKDILKMLKQPFTDEKAVIIDIKSIMEKEISENKNIHYWSL